MALELRSLTASAVHSLPRDKTVFLFPVGPLEPHGPHLPLGLDLIEAEWLAARLAEKIESSLQGWKAVIAPSAPLGVDTNSASGVRTPVRGHVLRDWLVDAARGLHTQGFKNFICVSGHRGPRQLSAIEEAGQMVVSPLRALFRRRDRVVFLSATSHLVSRSEVLKAPFIPEPAEHAGARDTSVGLFLAPDKVQPSHAALVAREKTGKGLWWRHSEKSKGPADPYWGDPSMASAAAGEATLQSDADKIFDALKPVLQGVGAGKDFRTLYSYLPPNRSFFKAWVIFFIALIAMTAWTFFFVVNLFTG